MSTETFGSALRRLRGNLSTRDVARLANVGKSYISALENDDQRLPSHQIIASLDSALKANGELLAFTEKERGARQTEALDLGERTTEDVSDVLRRIHKMNKAVAPEVIRQLRGNLQRIVSRYERFDHSDLVPALLDQRSWLDELIGECNHPRERQQLFEIASGTSGLLGYIAVGRGKFPLARAYCAEAFQLGDFAQDSNLQAWARGLQSFCEYYAQDYDEALRLAMDGLGHAKFGPQSVRLTVNCMARAMGKLGDVEGVHRAVGEAYELMSRNDVPPGLPSSITFECYSAAQTASNAATAYVSLEIPEKVQKYVDLALPDINSSDSPWSRSLVMIDSAVSMIISKEADMERASALVLDALSISANRPIISIQQRAMEFIRDASQRWGEVRQVAEIRQAVSTREIR
ncbi:helix-turn-helix transcriptional regulator [Streptosporangium sp. NPDC002524]|uniref:helix-turn-helix domain-containing protein n=1 Tax=Streptosporangium sp. NPDC002524 TaxID=3154537 RepID=UPI0033301AB6